MRFILYMLFGVGGVLVALALGVVFFGDGASNQGVVLESFNLAAFLSLRIVFICENNQYAQSTKLLDVSKTSVAEKDRGFGINSFEMRFNPKEFYYGLFITRIAIALIILVFIYLLVRRYYGKKS